MQIFRFVADFNVCNICASASDCIYIKLGVVYSCTNNARAHWYCVLMHNVSISYPLMLILNVVSRCGRGYASDQSQCPQSTSKKSSSSPAQQQDVAGKLRPLSLHGVAPWCRIKHFGSFIFKDVCQADFGL